MDPDRLLSSLALDWEEAKALLVVAVGIWIAAVVVLNTGPLVASGIVAAFVGLIGYSMLDADEV